MLIRTAAMLGLATWLGLSGSARAFEGEVNSRTILFLGDSITAAGGYVRVIEAELGKQLPPWRVINRGTSSETVSNLSEEYHPGRRP